MFEEVKGLLPIEYVDGGDLAICKGYSFRRDKETGYYLSAKPIGKRRKRLHVFVWETCSGQEVPKGYEIHHIDRDKRNNDYSNLILIQETHHRKIHGKDDIEKKRKNLLENAIPKAAEWHKSEAGREWHRQHAKEQAANWEYREEICDFCGKPYQTNGIRRVGNHFCSNNCKSAYRRATGVDNIEKKCERCGKTYIANKYSKTRFCPECRYRKD